MNREIKFRAWFPSEGKMYGWDDFKSYRLEKAFSLEDDVDTKIAMQYTGLKDKNGKEIYEEDIVILSEDRMGIKLVIEKYKTGFEFNQRNWGARLYESAMANNIEIIGNVHENPEML